MVNIKKLLSEISIKINCEISKIEEYRYIILYKKDGSPVTTADVYVEKFIRKYLEQQIPELKFIGEESFDFKEGFDCSGYVAILDPIDGTENFCSGLKEWGVSLGIWHNGIHQGSLLMMPELGESIITGDKLPKLHSRITGFSSSYTDEIATGIRDAGEYRVTGCAVYNLFNVIRGSFCRFINPKGAYVWDLLPGVMLALEHGCEVLLDDKPYYGEFLDPTRKYRVDIRHRYDLHPGQGT
jgi:myo-inositol-1(or 4)-monophosphatase